MLIGNADAQSDDRINTAPAPLGSAACAKDTCCTWKYVADEMLAKFRGPSWRCNAYARGAVRLGFHDAGAWKKGLAYGGADGSVILTDEITLRPANKGLEEITAVTKAWFVIFSRFVSAFNSNIRKGIINTSSTTSLQPILFKWARL
jgi:hypothetical protein